MKRKLTLGPVFFHWPLDKWRDFYFRIADEAPVDTVYIGEVVCSKRAPFYRPLYGAVVDRLRKAGKTVVFATLAEVMTKHDREMVEDLCTRDDIVIEVNDVSALWNLAGRPHTIGPFMNVYNEDTLAFLALRGAGHVCLPPELPAPSLGILGEKAAELGVTLEVQIYGRIPLALSARCYHARAHGLVKDNCRFVCQEDPDGMELRTLSGEPFLAVNGIQTLSYTCLNLAQELDDLNEFGVTHFRISPHSHDMVKVARLFRAALDRAMSPAEVSDRLRKTGLSVPFSNGFFHRKEGFRWAQLV